MHYVIVITQLRGNYCCKQALSSGYALGLGLYSNDILNTVLYYYISHLIGSGRDLITFKNHPPYGSNSGGMYKN